MKKSIFLFFAAILCAIGMNAATPTKIYLNAQDWGYGDARYAAYFFDPAMWVDMKKVDGETFIYEVDVPAGYTKVILCRMNGGTTANNWDNKWNQTGDLNIPTDGRNMFKPDDWNGKTTTWSTYTPTVTHTFAKNSTLYIDFRAITDKKGANYPKAGSVGIDYSANAGGTVIPVTFTADVKWTEGAEFMKTEKGDWASIPFKAPAAGQNCAQVAADGKSYTWTTYSEPSVTLSLDKTEADAGTNVTVTLTATADNVSGEVTYAFQYSTDNVTWNDITATGNTATQTFAAETRYYKVTMTNGGTTKEATAKFSAIKFHVIGSWDDWTAHNEVVEGSKTITLEANKTYEYKITNGTWDYSWGNDGTMERSNCTDWSFESNNNAKIKTDEAGDYVFNVSRNAEGKVKVSVTYPVSTPTYDVTVVDATVSTGTWSIDLAGTWEERTVTIQLWQDNVQGFGEYAANAETGYTCQLGNPYAELTPTTAGLYADNGDGTFTFTATMTDAEGGIYNISVSGDNPAVGPETKEWEGSTAFAKEEGTLSVNYEAEDWSWMLSLYIESYTGYGEYEVSDVYYGDVTGDYMLSGTATVAYDEYAETDVLTASLTTSDGSLIVLVTLYDATMPLMITNLRTEQVGAYLQLTGRNDMDDADVMLFLNDYTGEDKAYEVDTENSFMTYGGIELTVLDGSLTKSVDPEYGDMFTGVVNVYAEEEDMNLALKLTMYAAPATNVVVVNAVATYDDNSGALTLKGEWEDEEVSVEIAGYDGKESVEYNTAKGIKFETPDVAAFGNEASITVAGENITVVCTASSWTGDVFNVTITTLSKVGTALDNVTTTVAPAKAIVNGQLIIIKNGVQYNAQGAVVK